MKFRWLMAFKRTQLPAARHVPRDGRRVVSSSLDVVKLFENATELTQTEWPVVGTISTFGSMADCAHPGYANMHKSTRANAAIPGPIMPGLAAQWMRSPVAVVISRTMQ